MSFTLSLANSSNDSDGTSSLSSLSSFLPDAGSDAVSDAVSDAAPDAVPDDGDFALLEFLRDDTVELLISIVTMTTFVIFEIDISIRTNNVMNDINRIRGIINNINTMMSSVNVNTSTMVTAITSRNQNPYIIRAEESSNVFSAFITNTCCRLSSIDIKITTAFDYYITRYHEQIDGRLIAPSLQSTRSYPRVCVRDPSLPPREFTTFSCPICLSTISIDASAEFSACGHLFCASCVVELLSHSFSKSSVACSCPMCRCEVTNIAAASTDGASEISQIISSYSSYSSYNLRNEIFL